MRHVVGVAGQRGPPKQTLALLQHSRADRSPTETDASNWVHRGPNTHVRHRGMQSKAASPWAVRASKGAPRGFTPSQKNTNGWVLGKAKFARQTGCHRPRQPRPSKFCTMNSVPLRRLRPAGLGCPNRVTHSNNNARVCFAGKHDLKGPSQACIAHPRLPPCSTDLAVVVKGLPSLQNHQQKGISTTGLATLTPTSNWASVKWGMPGLDLDHPNVP